MLIRHFIGLSAAALIFCQPALADGTIPDRVEKLAASAVELDRNGERDAAVERMKDAMCLAELLNVPNADQADLLLKCSKTDDTKCGIRPGSRWDQNSVLSIYCNSELLRKFSIQSLDDIHLVESVWERRGEIPAGVPAKFRAEVLDLSSETTEQKRAKVKALVLFSTDSGYQDPRDWDALVRALDIAEQLPPPNLPLRREVLDKMLSSVPGDVDKNDLRFLRRAVESALEIKDPNFAPSVDTALNILFEHEDLASLVTVCEKAEARIRASGPEALSNPQFTQWVVPDILYTGWTYLVAGRLDDAKKKFEEASRLTKERSDCEHLYECAEVSLAKEEILAGETSSAEMRLLALINLLDAPSRADLSHYGAIANALLGTIQETKNNFEGARKHYEKADEGLMNADSLGPSEFAGFRGIKKQLPNDEFVLERLKVVYKRLGLPDKIEIAEKNLIRMKAAEEATRDRHSNRYDKIYSAIYRPRTEITGLVEPFEKFIESSDEESQAKSDKLNRAAEACIVRGLPNDALRLLDRAATYAQLPQTRNILKRNRGWALGILGDYKASNLILSEVTADGIKSEDEEFVAKSLMAKNLIAQHDAAAASKMLSDILSQWNPGSSRAKFFRDAVCDQAKLFIADKKFRDAEQCLKVYLRKPRRASDEYWAGESMAEKYPFALLAYTLVMNNKKDEASYLYAEAAKPDRNQPSYGVLIAHTANALADAALAFDDKDRARRFYNEAFKAYSDLDGFYKQAKACKASCDALL